MGEAAGTAAVVSLEEGNAAAEVPVDHLQTLLREQGAILDDSDIEAVRRADVEKAEGVS